MLVVPTRNVYKYPKYAVREVFQTSYNIDAFPVIDPAKFQSNTKETALRCAYHIKTI